MPLFQNESKCENEFCMQFHFHANQSHFHKNGFTLRLALKQRHKGTRKWSILWTTKLFSSAASVWAKLCHIKHIICTLRRGDMSPLIQEEEQR